MTVLEKGNISIHTENIFPIIKKSLYTDHEIFLRELISNAVDALSKLKMASLAGEVSFDVSEPEIVITIDKTDKSLSITDNGIGMNIDEIKKYINQVAFSSAEEFVKKYEKNASEIIGHFGLGFYSAFMISKRVEIDTLSYKEDSKPIHWSCDGSPSFELTESSRTEIGTTVKLTLMDEEHEYLEPERIRQLVKTYSDFVPIPIKFENTIINKQKALWKESTQGLNDNDYLEFYRYLYPYQEDPLLWIHLNTDYPYLLNGILYFPKLRPDVDVSQGHIKLFCNQVFVSDHCEEIIPDFLMPLRGVIDSPDIPLNVSRSALTNHRTVRSIANHIAKKIADRLKEIYENSPEEYIKCWQDVGTFVKYGSLKDEKFKKHVEDILVYKTTYKVNKSDVPQVQVEEEGDAWKDVTNEKNELSYEKTGYTTLSAYLSRNKKRHENRIFYCTDPDVQATHIQLYENQGLEILYMDSFIDTNYFIPFLEKEYSEVKFSRVDSELDDTLLQNDKVNEIVDPNSQKTRNDKIKELFEASLDNAKINIKTQSLKSDLSQDAPPGVILLPEAARRFKEMMAASQQQTMDFPDEHIFVVNTNHPLVENILQLSQGNIIQLENESPSGQMAKMLCRHIYDLALITQKGIDGKNMKSFMQRSNELLTNLTKSK
ncbi:molecular chaperone HtpG [Candidatus Atelocyanobacterium thalassae]|uniref:Chaperone protein HtpG n=1 Tax=cyanobacterium endosymbiont of Braarudosphaera bigelowii TaxID=1285375 RepID=A0ABM7U3M0_9CHRO|nr:molecular chaperone HtpG [Candidatus Atelocyanobacterium thalassa]BDA39288.1 chaperone protein HtpG [cyanobacterium endosymbiont of Braarudosphaera bigelowii]